MEISFWDYASQPPYSTEFSNNIYLSVLIFSGKEGNSVSFTADHQSDDTLPGTQSLAIAGPPSHCQPCAPLGNPLSATVSINQFRYINSQLNIEAWGNKINSNNRVNVFIRFPLFHSPKPRCQAE